MSRLHLTDDQLIDRLYGIDQTGGDRLDGHLNACPHCSSRLSEFQEKRVRTVKEVPAGAVLWADQRRQILERMEGSEPSWGWRRAWAPALLATGVLALGLWFYGPGNSAPTAPAPVVAGAIDSEWYEDTYSVMQPDEPRAASAIRVLFEQQEEKVTE